LLLKKVKEAQGSGFRKHAAFVPASQKLLGFRPHSPLRGTMPAQPSNGFFHPLLFAYLLKKLKREWREKSELERRHYPAPYDDFNLIPSLWDKVNLLKISHQKDKQSTKKLPLI